jgi:hypothetical protein
MGAVVASPTPMRSRPIATTSASCGRAPTPGHATAALSFGKVHSLRQRRAMRRLLCQVCGEPADQSEDGVLWLLPDYRGDWPGWPNRMGQVEPPICRPCVDLSLRLCPKLRRGAAVVRAREYPIAGVRGVRYEPGPTAPVMVEPVVVSFEDHAIRWIRAVGLVRELLGCTLLSPEELAEGQS